MPHSIICIKSFHFLKKQYNPTFNFPVQLAYILPWMVWRRTDKVCAYTTQTQLRLGWPIGAQSRARAFSGWLSLKQELGPNRTAPLYWLMACECSECNGDRFCLSRLTLLPRSRWSRRESTAQRNQRRPEMCHLNFDANLTFSAHYSCLARCNVTSRHNSKFPPSVIRVFIVSPGKRSPRERYKN